MNKEPTLTIDELSREVRNFNSNASHRVSTPERRAKELIDETVYQLFPEQSFRFDDEIVKNSLDELLLVLIALRDEQTHGKELMNDLASVFDSRLSPGTVYPRLHELEEEGMLAVHELVRTKEYRINDPEATRMAIQAAMSQHIALGYVLFTALQEM